MRSILAMILILSSVIPALAAERDIVDTASAAGFKTLVSAIQTAGLTDTLKAKGPFTIFAPTDEAFAKLPAGTLEELFKPRNRGKLQALLSHHVLAGRSMAADIVKLDGRSVETVRGGQIEVTVKAGIVHLGEAIVIKVDNAAGNGVIHGIDTVLIPTTDKRAASSNPSPPRLQPKPADGDAPLAEGFPGATNPGVVEVKRYPAYRSAVASIHKAGVSSGNLLFFSLFNHIQKNQIEMTAPVINTYKTPRMIETPGATGDVTMEFVYRSPTEGKTGPDGSTVDVVDHPAHYFVCLGVQGGDLNSDQMRTALVTIRAWLDQHKGEWVEDGSPRRLGYHGPMTPSTQRLWEVQIPIKSAR